jgi:hypothetical protein
MWGITLQQRDDLSFAPVTSEGGGRFRSAEGRILETTGCAHIVADAPALLVHTRSGKTEVRHDGAVCPVTRVGPN